MYRRRYCERYGLDPRTVDLTPREAAAERALEELELEGLAPSSRLDFLLGANVSLTRFLVLAKGVDAGDLERFVESGAANVVRRPVESQEERRAREMETSRRFFEVLGAFSCETGDKQ